MLQSRPQSNMLKKCFWEFPKHFTYYALHASHYACIMLQIDVKSLLLECSIRVFMIQE